MNEKIAAAMRQPPDYSVGFTEMMIGIRTKVGRALNSAVYLDSDMNYSSCQRLSVYIQPDGVLVEKDSESAAWRIDFLISSRGKFFTRVGLQRMSRKEWKVVRVTSDFTLVHRIGRVLEKEGFEPVPIDILEESADGFLTEMDGVPATVFQVLFSEMY